MRIQQLQMKGLLKNFTYLIICEKTKKVAIIDPAYAGRKLKCKLRRITTYLKQNDYHLEYIINTHRHYDHVNGNSFMKSCPPDTIVWPGHDLGKTKTTTLKYEQTHNVNSEEYRLTL